MPVTWTPEEVLAFDVDEAPNHCVGTTTAGRRCRESINSTNRQRAEVFMATLPELVEFRTNHTASLTLLKDLAKIVLCLSHHHRDPQQVDDITTIWLRDILRLEARTAPEVSTSATDGVLDAGASVHNLRNLHIHFHNDSDTAVENVRPSLNDAPLTHDVAAGLSRSIVGTVGSSEGLRRSSRIAQQGYKRNGFGSVYLRSRPRHLLTYHARAWCSLATNGSRLGSNSNPTCISSSVRYESLFTRWLGQYSQFIRFRSYAHRARCSPCCK